jgi:hypothetical protein
MSEEHHEIFQSRFQPDMFRSTHFKMKPPIKYEARTASRNNYMVTHIIIWRNFYAWFLILAITKYCEENFIMDF